MGKSTSIGSNLGKFKDDLEALISKGEILLIAIQYECFPKEFGERLKHLHPDTYQQIIKDIPNFTSDYQAWYSEAKSLIRQLLPDRLEDFSRYYEKPRTRKEISCENYRIEDFLQGIHATRGIEKMKVAGRDDAIPLFRQQLEIVRSIKNRLESSLFDIHQLVQADIFDSEIEAAKELVKSKFTRAAGALAGVVLERHLSQVCNNHNLSITKKALCISELNDILKKFNIIETPLWRNIQYLGDIRNLCDHDKQTEPTVDQVNDLINGVAKIIKTLF